MDGWAPRTITSAIRTLQTSLGTAEVETDSGRAYFKPFDNPEGPHALASEWVGTRLAAWLGLETFELALLSYDGVARVLRKDGAPVKPGIGLVARAEKGFTLKDDIRLLIKISNVDAISKIVVFDTWIRNRDRYLTDRGPNYGNLFLSRERAPKGKYRLLAMDHTHCFADICELSPRLSEDRIIRDNRLYGLFPEFVTLLNRRAIQEACGRLQQIEGSTATRFIADLPSEWEVDSQTRTSWSTMITQRAEFVASTILHKLEREYPSQLSANMDTD